MGEVDRWSLACGISHIAHGTILVMVIDCVVADRGFVRVGKQLLGRFIMSFVNGFVLYDSIVVNVHPEIVLCPMNRIFRR